MNVAPGAPKRPALRYYGGKWRLAPWIISHFPPHQNYVEPCGGAASVLLQKPRSPLETYNDLDGNVVNFFRVLRDRPDELVWAVTMTPYAKSEFQLMPENAQDSLEQARRFFFRSFSGMAGVMHRGIIGTWRIDKTAVYSDGNPRYKNSPDQYISSTESLFSVAARMRLVQIENDTAYNIIVKYSNADSLLYIDPPYVHDTRTCANGYAFEWADADHITAADLLRQAAGYVIVSGYACPLYTELYEAHGWQRVDKEARINGRNSRIESLWLSPRTVEALAMPEQLALI